MTSCPRCLHGSGAYWILIVGVACGGGRSLATGGARGPVELDEAAGSSFIEPALFFVDEKPSASEVSIG